MAIQRLGRNQPPAAACSGGGACYPAAVLCVLCGWRRGHGRPPASTPQTQEASETYLKDILGYEENQLVSTDYVNDVRSSIVDAPCTQARTDAGVCMRALWCARRSAPLSQR